jgi:hypothetical protein
MAAGAAAVVVGGARKSSAGKPKSAQVDSVILRRNTWREIVALPADFKGRAAARGVETVDTVLVHQTAAPKGFGLTAQQINAADGGALAALEQRYRSTPYHGVYSPRGSSRTAKVASTMGVSAVQWPVWAYSNHGHGGNSVSVGWAYDGALPGDALDVEGGRQAFAHFVGEARAQGAPIKYVETHAQHSAERGGDPGDEIWEKIIRPMLGPLGLAVRARTTGDGAVPAWL